MSKPCKPRSAASPLCATPDCRKKKANLGNGRRANYCSTCRSRRWRANNPISAAYYNLKHRAKERGHEFRITMKQFREWCEKTKYHILKGKRADGMSIDRKRETEGYHIDNIQMMTLGENASKENYRRIGMAPPEPNKPYSEEDRPW